MKPTPTPPNHVLICMFSISIIPERGIVESCIPFTEAESNNTIATITCFNIYFNAIYKHVKAPPKFKRDREADAQKGGAR